MICLRSGELFYCDKMYHNDLEQRKIFAMIFHQSKLFLFRNYLFFNFPKELKLHSRMEC